MTSEKISWPGGPSIKQNFSLPTSIIYYMAKNPSSPEVYNIIIRTCKYFFEKHPLLVVAHMSGSTKLCSRADCNGNSPCCVAVDIKKLKSKLWLTHKLDLDEHPDAVSFLLSKLYRSETSHLLAGNRNINYEDFKLLITPALENLFFEDVAITDNDGKPVMLEVICALLPNIEEFYFSFKHDLSMANASTIKNFLKLKRFERLKYLQLSSMPEIISVEDLSALLKSYQDTKIWLGFDINISEEYKVQVDALIDDVIESEIPDRLICYRDQDNDKFMVMKNRYSGVF